jgi:hypothetical protein
MEPIRVLTAQEVPERVCAYYGCPHKADLAISEKLLDYALVQDHETCCAMGSSSSQASEVQIRCFSSSTRSIRAGSAMARLPCTHLARSDSATDSCSAQDMRRYDNHLLA